jgi:signal transduction histidine kinase
MYGGVQPAGCIDARGEIWFPGSRGPVRISVDRGGPASPPTAFISRVLADGRNVGTSGSVRLAPGGGKLEVQYGAIRLRSQERVRFRYRLEGFDPEWTESTEHRVASYTNLGPGHYRFRVLAFDMSNPRGASEASLDIDWAAHFYQSAWFFALCGACLAAAVWGMHKLRMRQAHERFAGVLEERGRLAREMHDTLIRGCTSASVLLEAALSLRNSTPEMKQELLENARDLVRDTIAESRQAVWNLRERPPTPGGIAVHLSELTKQIGAQSGIPVTLEASGAPVAVDQEREHHLLLATREALNNAVLHGHAKNIRVTLRADRRTLRIVIEDDGRGFDQDAPAAAAGHYGLTGMRERVEYLDGKLELETKPGQGTRVTITAPLKKIPPKTGTREEAHGGA